MAKNIVAAGLAKKCTIQLSYAIGIAEPLSLYVDTHGTGTVDEARLEAVLPKLLRLTPKGIRTHLGLNKPIYQPTASYGHFGREANGDFFSWERTDLVDALKQRSEEHTSELQSLMRISYAVFCLKKKNT